MDVVTRTVDLSRAIIDVLNKENSLRAAAQEILEWLGRERIDKQEYQYCIEALRGKAFPNRRGLGIQNEVQLSEERMLSVAGLKLRLSSSIGRWMLKDPSLIYVVTTVAVCMMHHDLTYAVEVLCNLALDQGGHEKGISYGRSHYRLRLKPVITKFVDSIALNVVNAGHDFHSALPDALKNICSHPLEAPQFSAITKAVIDAQSDIVITCDLFPGDLVMWLLTHSHGGLEISLNGTVVFEEDSGTDRLRVIMMIYNKCSICPNKKGDFKYSNIRVATKLEGTTITLINESYCFNHESKSCTRQQLYDINMITDWRKGKLTRNEVAQVKVAAQSILRWVMQLEVGISENNPVFLVSRNNLYKHNGGDSRPAAHMTDVFENLLAGYPTLLHQNLGDFGARDRQTIYEPPQDHPMDGSEDETPEVFPMSTSQVFECFPVAVSLFEMVQQRCSCICCTSGKAIGTGSLGCLREASLDELIFFITHGISEAFGARDVSGLWNPTLIRDAVCEVFEDIIRRSSVQWDRWFRLVALVYVGGNLTKIPSWAERSIASEEDPSGVVAYQRGSLVMAAAWLDMTSDTLAHRAFKAKFGEGQICGISNDEAEIWSGPGMSLDAPKEIQHHTPTSEDLAEWDDDICLMELALISTGERSYRLLTMMKSASYRRLIDPFNAVLGSFRSRYPECVHSRSQESNVPPGDKKLSLVTFDQIVGSFSLNPADMKDTPAWQPNTIQVTRILDTSTKFNLALSLAPDGAVVDAGGSCCLDCACKETELLAAPPCIIRRVPVNFHALKKLAGTSQSYIG